MSHHGFAAVVDDLGRPRRRAAPSGDALGRGPCHVCRTKDATYVRGKTVCIFVMRLVQMCRLPGVYEAGMLLKAADDLLCRHGALRHLERRVQCVQGPC